MGDSHSAWRHAVGQEGQVITSFITEDGSPRCDYVCVCVYLLSMKIQVFHMILEGIDKFLEQF